MMKSKRVSARLLRGGGGYQRVSGAAAETLPDSVAETNSEDLPPGTREGEHRSKDVRDPIPRDRECLQMSDPVRKIARCELQQAGGRIRDSFDQPQRRGAAAHRRQERGKQWRHHV